MRLYIVSRTRPGREAELAIVRPCVFQDLDEAMELVIGLFDRELDQSRLPYIDRWNPDDGPLIVQLKGQIVRVDLLNV